MANPSYYQNFPPVTSLVSHQEHRIDIVGRLFTRKNIVVPPRVEGLPNIFGSTDVIDWELRRDRVVVARLQGITAVADSGTEEIRYLSANLVLTEHRFAGSILMVQGRLGPQTHEERGNWAVVGGTGMFAHAQGNAAYKRIRDDPRCGATIDLKIRVFCLKFPQQEPFRKVGPWGREVGEIHDVEKLPRRLESISVYANIVVQSIAFSYTDEAGRKHTSRPWGGVQNKRARQSINLGASETVTKIIGSTGKYNGRTVVKSLTIFTSNNNSNDDKSYAYGKETNEDTTFRVVAENNDSIVGFFGCADGEAVSMIGAYVRHN